MKMQVFIDLDFLTTSAPRKTDFSEPGILDLGQIAVRDISQVFCPKSQEKCIFGVFHTRTFF